MAIEIGLVLQQVGGMIVVFGLAERLTLEPEPVVLPRQLHGALLQPLVLLAFGFGHGSQRLLYRTACPLPYALIPCQALPSGGLSSMDVSASSCETAAWISGSVSLSVSTLAMSVFKLPASSLCASRRCELLDGGLRLGRSRSTCWLP